MTLMLFTVASSAACTMAPPAPSEEGDDAPKRSTSGTIPGPAPAGGDEDDDASSDAPPAEGYKPAFLRELSVPTLQNQGGQILSHPDIVTVTWTSDPMASTFERIGDNIGTTEYWKAIVSEYGVGPATGGKHVHLSNARSQMSIEQLEQMIINAVSNPSSSGWPAPTTRSLYVVYFPQGSTLTENGQDECQQFEGFHSSVTLPNGHEVAYGVVQQCSYGGPVDPGETTLIATHEIAEAAVDPYGSPAWLGIDGKHLGWDIMQAFQNENGDLCEYFTESYLESPTPALPLVVQRMWSNASALAGHNPCVPAPPEPYFNVTPLDALGSVTVDLGSLNPPTGESSGTGDGIRLSGTTPSTITLGLFADAPMPAWEIDAYEAEPGTPFDQNGGIFPRASHPTVQVTLDHATGNNGDKVTLTIRQTSSSSLSSSSMGGALVIVRSKHGQSAHYLPILVGDQ